MYDALLRRSDCLKSLARSVCVSAALASCLMLAPGLALAKNADFTNDAPCHPLIQLITPEIETEAELLHEITFAFTESHDADCRLDIVLKQSPYYTCQQPQIKKTISSDAAGDMRSRNDVTLICRYRQDGYYMTAPFTVRYLREQEEVWRYDTKIPAVHIVLSEVTPKELEIRHSLKPWRRRLSPIFWMILLALVSCAAAMVLFCRKVKQQQEATNSVLPVEDDIVPPIEVFNSKIAKLVDQEPEGEDRVKAYYDSLSEAIRRFLSDRFELPIMESTTGQLRTVLNQRLVEGQIDEIVRILQECDLIKFARMMPSPTKRIAIVRDTSHIISTIDTYINTKTLQNNESAELNHNSQELFAGAAVAAKSIETTNSSSNNQKVFTPQNVWASSTTSEEFKKKYSTRDSHDGESGGLSTVNVFDDFLVQYPAHDSVTVSPVKLMDIQSTNVQPPMDKLWKPRSNVRKSVSPEPLGDSVRCASDQARPVNRPSTVSVSLSGRAVISRELDVPVLRSEGAFSNDTHTTLKTHAQFETDPSPLIETSVRSSSELIIIADDGSSARPETPKPLNLTHSKENAPKLSSNDLEPVIPRNT